MEKRNETSFFHEWMKYYWSPISLAARLAVGILAMIHCRISDRTIRSFRELFYWPNGFCADMVVVSLALAIFVMILFGDIRMKCRMIASYLE